MGYGSDLIAFGLAEITSGTAARADVSICKECRCGMQGCIMPYTYSETLREGMVSMVYMRLCKLSRANTTKTHLAMRVKLVGGNAIKDANLVEGQPRQAMHCPAHADLVILFLPNALHFNKQLLEKEVAVEAQGPEDGPVLFHPMKSVARVTENNILPVYAICMWLWPVKKPVCSKRCSYAIAQRVPE